MSPSARSKTGGQTCLYRKPDILEGKHGGDKRPDSLLAPCTPKDRNSNEQENWTSKLNFSPAENDTESILSSQSSPFPFYITSPLFSKFLPSDHPSSSSSLRPLLWVVLIRYLLQGLSITAKIVAGLFTEQGSLDIH